MSFAWYFVSSWGPNENFYVGFLLDKTRELNNRLNAIQGSKDWDDGAQRGWGLGWSKS